MIFVQVAGVSKVPTSKCQCAHWQSRNMLRHVQVELWNPFLPFGPGSSVHVLRSLAAIRLEQMASKIDARPRKHSGPERLAAVFYTMPGSSFLERDCDLRKVLQELC